MTTAVDASPASAWAKSRDYWWTVLAVDPLAVPLARYLARKRWLSADQVTWVSMLLGLPVGLAYAFGWLIAGGALFYISFLFDCVDGKLARAFGTLGSHGQSLDIMADGARRASASLGLALYLYRYDGGGGFWWAVVYGILAFYFNQMSGGTREEPATKIGGRWSEALGRRRLLPTPGTPDVAALVFVIGPITGLVVPALAVGCAMLGVGILLLVYRFARRSRRGTPP